MNTQMPADPKKPKTSTLMIAGFALGVLTVVVVILLT
jgi:uncharacterized protein involved in exopolysaccharide biosynthesis